MDNKNYCLDVSAVLVTYNPSLDELNASIRAICGQVSNLFIVDNGSSNFSSNWLQIIQIQQAETKIHWVPQSENLGIAAAHNIGIDCALKQNAKFVILLDQDSQASHDMVAKLYSAYIRLNEDGVKLAGIGPQYHDADNGRLSGFVTVGWFSFKNHNQTDEASVVEADFLISSGSLIAVAALSEIGLMDARLFIDHVDTEWCFRAKSKGYRLFGLCGAIMTHSLGERRAEIWFLRKRIVPFHKPFRYYYIFRNSVFLLGRSYMPIKFKLADVTRCLKMIVFFSLFGENRLSCLKMMLLGIAHGLKGQYGKLR